MYIERKRTNKTLAKPVQAACTLECQVTVVTSWQLFCLFPHHWVKYGCRNSCSTSSRFLPFVSGSKNTKNTSPKNLSVALRPNNIGCPRWSVNMRKVMEMIRLLIQFTGVAKSQWWYFLPSWWSKAEAPCWGKRMQCTQTRPRSQGRQVCYWGSC